MQTRGAAPRRRKPSPGARVALALLGTLACLAAVVVVYQAFVMSLAGQQIDQSALEGAHLGRSRVIDIALSVLGLVSAAGLVIATLLVVVIASVRRRVDLAVGALVLVVGANVTSQAVKYAFADRPQLGIDAGLHNSLPSGHATVAASLAAAAVLVVPSRARPWMALAGALAATLAGVSTLAAGWHRPSDVIAATMIVGAWAGIVAAVLGLRPERITRPIAVRHMPVITGFLAVSGLALLALAGIAYGQVSTLSGIAERRRDLFIAYAGGSAAIAGATAMVFVFVLAAFGHVAATHDRGLRYDAVGDVVDDSVGTVESAAARSTRTFASGA